VFACYAEDLGLTGLVDLWEYRYLAQEESPEELEMLWDEDQLHREALGLCNRHSLDDQWSESDLVQMVYNPSWYVSSFDEYWSECSDSARDRFCLMMREAALIALQMRKGIYMDPVDIELSRYDYDLEYYTASKAAAKVRRAQRHYTKVQDQGNRDDRRRRRYRRNIEATRGPQWAKHKPSFSPLRHNRTLLLETELWTEQNWQDDAQELAARDEDGIARERDEREYRDELREYQWWLDDLFYQIYYDGYYDGVCSCSDCTGEQPESDEEPEFYWAEPGDYGLLDVTFVGLSSSGGRRRKMARGPQWAKHKPGFNPRKPERYKFDIRKVATFVA